MNGVYCLGETSNVWDSKEMCKVLGAVTILTAAVALFVLGCMAVNGSFPSALPPIMLAGLAIGVGGAKTLFSFCNDLEQDDRLLSAIAGIALIVLGALTLHGTLSLFQLGLGVVVIGGFCMGYDLIKKSKNTFL